MEIPSTWVNAGAADIEAMAMVLIVGAFLWGSIRFLLTAGQRGPNSYQKLKVFLGRSLSLGLEFLVAADVIRTVGVGPTLSNIGVLGAVIAARTFLSWSLVVEMEGRWPWQPATGPRTE